MLKAGGGTSDVLLQLQLSPDGQQPGAAAAVFLNPLSRLQYEFLRLLHVTCRRSRTMQRNRRSLPNGALNQTYRSLLMDGIHTDSQIGALSQF